MGKLNQQNSSLNMFLLIPEIIISERKKKRHKSDKSCCRFFFDTVKAFREYQKVKQDNFPILNVFPLQWNSLPVDKNVEITLRMFHAMTSM